MAKKKAASPRAGSDAPAPVTAEMSVAEIIAAVPHARPKPRARRTPVRPIGDAEPDRDILDQYLYEVSLTPLLTQPQEIALARRVQAGDEDACRSWSSGTSASSSRSPRNTRIGAWRWST
jgi:hypothetical protein